MLDVVYLEILKIVENGSRVKSYIVQNFLWVDGCIQ
jgi:hypothetical protein